MKVKRIGKEKIEVIDEELTVRINRSLKYKDRTRVIVELPSGADYDYEFRRHRIVITAQNEGE